MSITLLFLFKYNYKNNYLIKIQFMNSMKIAIKKLFYDNKNYLYLKKLFNYLMIYSVQNIIYISVNHLEFVQN